MLQWLAAVCFCNTMGMYPGVRSDSDMHTLGYKCNTRRPLQ